MRLLTLPRNMYMKVCGYLLVPALVPQQNESTIATEEYR